MRIAESVALYGLIGLACGIYLVRSEPRSWASKAAMVLLALPFWPLLLPLLHPKSGPEEPPGRKKPPGKGPYSLKLKQALDRIEEAICQTEGTAGTLLSREKQVLGDLRHQLLSRNQQLAELDQVLVQPEFQEAELERKRSQLASTDISDRARENLQIQIANIEQLRALRKELAENVEEVLGMLDRIHSQITLLRFTGSETDAVGAALEQLLCVIEGIQEAPSLDGSA